VASWKMRFSMASALLALAALLGASAADVPQPAISLLSPQGIRFEVAGKPSQELTLLRDGCWLLSIVSDESPSWTLAERTNVLWFHVFQTSPAQALWRFTTALTRRFLECKPVNGILMRARSRAVRK